MNKYRRHTLRVSIAAALLSLASSQSAYAQSKDAKTVYEALASGKASVDLNLRYETVDQASKDASALTLRTRMGYTTANYQGWSFSAIVEDSRVVLGQGDYTVGPTAYNLGLHSVIADPEVTELDSGFLQYKNKEFTFKLGRQVIALDGQRFLGHVGWRQDRQTFDAATFVYSPNDKFNAQYSYITQRNRIFAEVADIDAKDHLINTSYETSVGKLVGYAYLLEVDNSSDNSIDTYGASFTGKTKTDIPIMYAAEYAMQSNGAFDASYVNLSVGTSFKGIKAKLGYEVLGSDNGAYGFATPLATLHKFNGWADKFLGTPAQGLQDVSLTFSGTLTGGTWMAVYHDYSADDSSTTIDDLGDEVNLQYVTKFATKYTLGIKYANYSEGDNVGGDVDKLWLWVATKF